MNTGTPAADRRLLVVDGDADFREALADQLRRHAAFAIDVAATAAEALARVRQARYDALLLDERLPDMDGRDLCRLLRRDGPDTPIVMLTGPDTGAGADTGADDHVARPFRLGVLLARLRAQMRQRETAGDPAIAIGPWSFRPAQKLLIDRDSGRKIRLTEKETAILEFLHRAGGRIVPRRTLLADIWGYNAGVATHTLETHVYRLRRKIEKDPGRAEILLTGPGGYRLGP